MRIPHKIRPPSEPGFPVLKLPKHGEELVEGRQYELTPLARAVIDETLGLVLPRVVECLHRRRPPMRYATQSWNLETDEIKWSLMEEPLTEATFRAWMGHGKIFKFCLDLPWLAERQHAMKGSHKAREYEEKDKADMPKSYQKSSGPRKEREPRIKVEDLNKIIDMTL